MKKIIIIIAILVVIVIGVYLFTSNNKSSNVIPVDNSQTSTTTTTTSTTTTSTTPAPADKSPLTVLVDIKNFSFNPKVMTIKTGTTVTWVNDDSVAHTVTAGNIFDSGAISPGKSFSFTFTNMVASINYHCSIHPMMTGQIIVQL